LPTCENEVGDLLHSSRLCWGCSCDIAIILFCAFSHVFAGVLPTADFGAGLYTICVVSAGLTPSFRSMWPAFLDWHPAHCIVSKKFFRLLSCTLHNVKDNYCPDSTKKEAPQLVTAKRIQALSSGKVHMSRHGGRNRTSLHQCEKHGVWHQVVTN
jgi:hypothetical protein